MFWKKKALNFLDESLKTTCEGVHLSLELHAVETPLLVFHKNVSKNLKLFILSQQILEGQF